MTQAYKLTQENKEIVIRVNKDLFTEEKLTTFLDYLTLENIAYSSKLTSEKATEMAQEIDQKIWSSIKTRILSRY